MFRNRTATLMLVLWAAGKYYNCHIWTYGSWGWISVAHLHHFIPHLRTSGFVTCGHTNDGYSRDNSKWETLTMVAWCVYPFTGCVVQEEHFLFACSHLRPKSGVMRTHWKMIWVSKSCETDISIGVRLLSPGGFNLIVLTKSHDHIFTQVVTRAPTNAHTQNPPKKTNI